MEEKSALLDTVFVGIGRVAGFQKKAGPASKVTQHCKCKAQRKKTPFPSGVNNQNLSNALD